MRQVRTFEYENLDTNYNYGSLAVDIWANAEQEEVAPAPKKVAKKKKFSWRFFKRAEKPLIREVTKVHPKNGVNYRAKLVKTASAVSFGVVMFVYLSCVYFGNLTISAQVQLVAMQHVEARLISEINEMQIVVEQMKGPERIREIATTKLNMVVARDNVYVNASKSKTIGEMYHAQPADDMFFALGK